QRQRALSVSGLLAQPYLDAAQREDGLAVGIADLDTLLVDDAGSGFAHFLQGFQRLARYVPPVLPHQQERLLLLEAEDEPARAEIAIRDEQILGPYARQNVRQQGALLGIRIFAQDHIGHQAESRF